MIAIIPSLFLQTDPGSQIPKLKPPKSSISSSSILSNESQVLSNQAATRNRAFQELDGLEIMHNPANLRLVKTQPVGADKTTKRSLLMRLTTSAIVPV